MGCQVHQSCRKQFRLVSLLSVPSKILEAETNDRLVKMVKMDLYTRALHGTLISSLDWDSDSVVAAAFMDFRKTFDSVAKKSYWKNLTVIWNQRRFTRMDKSYLEGRVHLLRGIEWNRSHYLLQLVYPRDWFWARHFANDLLTAVRSGSLFMFVDDTSIFFIGKSADSSIALLNTWQGFVCKKSTNGVWKIDWHQLENFYRKNPSCIESKERLYFTYVSFKIQ